MVSDQGKGARFVSIGGDDARVDHSVDGLAKELAKGTVSRRQVLRWIGSAIAGVALAWVPGCAEAQANSPYWGEFKEDHCTTPGFRQHSAILWDIPPDQDWKRACETTPATIEGQEFPGADRCPQSWGRQWGEFDVPDDSCGCPTKFTTKTACIAFGPLWCRDYCGIAQEPGARPVSGWYICGVCFGFDW